MTLENTMNTENKVVSDGGTGPSATGNAADTSHTQEQPMPAPHGSANAATHCLTMTKRAAERGDRAYRRFPKQMRYIQQEASDDASRFVARLEASGVVLSDDDWDSVETATPWKLHALNVLRELRTNYQNLSSERRIQLTAEHAQAVAKRAAERRRVTSRPAADGNVWATIKPVGGSNG